MQIGKLVFPSMWHVDGIELTGAELKTTIEFEQLVVISNNLFFRVVEILSSISNLTVPFLIHNSYIFVVNNNQYKQYFVT